MSAVVRQRTIIYVSSLALLCACATAPPVRRSPPFEVTEATIAGTRAALLRGEVTCREIVQRYLLRIAAYDRARLNAIVLVNTAALADADALDRELSRSHRARALHCVTVIVKDNFDTAGLQTTGGSLALKGFVPAKDAYVVQRLREAGAIVLAKSNMAEWAFDPYATDSSIAGTTRNPYALERVPAGSSGGTAAAVAASLGAVGLGTDTGNSIRGPAAHNGLTGIRPTMGRVSRDGIIPLFSGNDIAGPIARTVSDAAAVLSVVAGVDANDPMTNAARGQSSLDTVLPLNPSALRGARVGVFRRYVDAADADPEVAELTGRAIAELRGAGAEIIDPFDIPGFEKLTEHLWCADFQSDLNRYLSAHAGGTLRYRTLADIFASGLYLPQNADELKYFLHAAPDSGCRGPYEDPPKIEFRRAILSAMDSAQLDAFVYPTWSNPPRLVGDRKSPAGDNSQLISPQSGLPAITVPMGFTHDTLPAGLTIVGRLWSDAQLLQYAFAYETATHHRRPPASFPPLPPR